MKLCFLTLTAHTDHEINILDETFSMLKDTITHYYPLLIINQWFQLWILNKISIMCLCHSISSYLYIF
jgi:hypothetical protein